MFNLQGIGYHWVPSLCLFYRHRNRRHRHRRLLGLSPTWRQLIVHWIHSEYPFDALFFIRHWLVFSTRSNCVLFNWGLYLYTGLYFCMDLQSFWWSPSFLSTSCFIKVCSSVYPMSAFVPTRGKITFPPTFTVCSLKGFLWSVQYNLTGTLASPWVWVLSLSIWSQVKTSSFSQGEKGEVGGFRVTSQEVKSKSLGGGQSSLGQVTGAT